jgi:DNA-binding transcriptional ArsR family regulator
MDVFEALADPRRRRIIELVADMEIEAGHIAAQFSISRPAVSRHLRVLRQARLIAVRSQGTRKLYSLAPAPLAEVDEWLTRSRRFWASHLNKLDDYVEAATGRKEIK